MKVLFLVVLGLVVVLGQDYDESEISPWLKPVGTNGILCYQCFQIEGSKMRCNHRDEWKPTQCKPGQACMTNWYGYTVLQRGCYGVRNIDLGCQKIAEDDYVCYCADRDFCNH